MSTAVSTPVPVSVPLTVSKSAAAVTPPTRISAAVAGISLEGVRFDARSHRLEVADQPKGPASQWSDCQTAGQALKAIAAINAGFFTPEGAPLGLVVTAGQARGGWNGASSLGSGVWFEDRAGHSAIARREKIGAAAARNMRELIQAGPMLVEARGGVGGLDELKASPRTVLLWDGGTRWLMARTGPCTLAGLARALAGASPAGWPVVSALNLDGGRSAEIWVSGAVAGGGLFTRPVWNKPVRNFLLLKSR